MRGATACLVLVLLVAGALRVWGLDLSLPNVDGRPDEREMLAFTAGFPSADLNPRWFVYPGLFMYLTWLWVEGGLALRRLVTPTPDYATALRDALPLVLYAARWLSAVAGTVSVWLAYRVAGRGGNVTRGLVAAAILATCWLHVRDSHFVKTEALLTAGVLAATGLLARWAESGRRAHAVAAGVAIGLAMGIKYPAAFVLVAAYVADLLRPRRPPGVARALPSGDLVLLALAAAAAFGATSPYLLLDFARTRDTASFLGLALYAPRPGTAAAVEPLGAAVEWVRSRAFGYHVTTSLRYGCGLVATLALPFALVRAFRSREPLLVLSATLFLPFFLVAGASPVRLARYLTPVTPLAAIVLADGIVALAGRAGDGRRRAAGAAVLTALVVAEPLAASVRGDRIAAQEDTRVLATEWLQRHLPRGARVAVIGSRILPQGAPTLPPGVARVAADPAVDALVAAGATHVVTHDHPLQFSTVEPATMAAYERSLRLVAEFSPFAGPAGGGYEQEDAYYLPFFDFDGVVRPGPRIRVFAVGAPARGARGPSWRLTSNRGPRRG